MYNTEKLKKMKNINLSKTNKIILISLAFLFFAFTLGDSKSEYLVPRAAYSVFANDLDLDGDIDIVSGHMYNSETEWGGVAFLTNNSFGDFTLLDTISFDYGFSQVRGSYFDDNEFIDIFSNTFSTDLSTRVFTIIYNYGESQFDSIASFPIYADGPIPEIASGDVNGDGFSDLLLAHNNGFLWGILYNDGTGNFLEPEYFDLSFPPIDLISVDLNQDDKDDVIISGSNTEIYYWTENGFEQQILTNTSTLNVLTADFDNDGDQDIITHRTIGFPNHRVYLFENLGNKQFYEHPYFDISTFCTYAKTADLDNDNLPELIFVADDDSGLYIFHNKGDFQVEFDQLLPIENYGSMLNRIDCADFDQNGFIDIVGVIYSHTQKPANLYVLFNDGQGNFVENPVLIKEKSLSNKKQTSCYPNPFSSTTQIWYKLDQDSKVEIKVYNHIGQLVKTYTEGSQSKGSHHINFDAKDLTSGMYFYSITVDGQLTDSKKMTLIK